MIFLNRLRWPALAGILVLMAVVACEEDPTTLGAGIIGSDPFNTSKAEYEVFAFNKKIEAVQTNKLPIYQLGIYNDPLYGQTEARITSQLRLSQVNPTFGSFSKEVEDNLDFDEPLQRLGDENEDETVTEVFLYIPFLTKSQQQRDSDLDGVDDVFDSDPSDPNNDNDGDGVGNATENANGTDPLDPESFEVNDTNPANTFAKQFDLDSIYGARDQAFRLKVEQSTYFLRDLDPDTNFEQAEEYFSNNLDIPSFVSEELFNGDLQISDKEILLFFKEDDPDTDADETALVETRLNPGLRIPLDTEFFQENLIDKEGDVALLSQGNFTEFLRGIHLSLVPAMNQELLLMLDLNNANITITYDYNRVNNNGTTIDISDDIVETVEGNFVLNLLQSQSGLVIGNAVNTFINEAYPPQVLNQMDIFDQMNNPINADRIYLKGGAGAYAEIRLFDMDGDDTAEAISQIKANNWIINEANLVFYVDRTTVDAAGVAPTGNDEPLREPERLYLYNAESGFPLINFLTEVTAEETLYGSFLNYDGIVDLDSQGKADKYTIKITDHINNLVFRDSANVSLGLTMTPDISRIGTLNAMVNEGAEKALPFISTVTPAGTVLFGGDEDKVPADKRLKLEIFYTEAN